MVEAQTRMDTPLLIALMIMAALVGYAIDQLILLVSRVLAPWRYLEG